VSVTKQIQGLADVKRNLLRESAAWSLVVVPPLAFESPRSPCVECEKLTANGRQQLFSANQCKVVLFITNSKYGRCMICSRLQTYHLGLVT